MYAEWSTTVEYTFFSSTHDMFSKIDNMLGHKTILVNFKTEITQSIFSDHNIIKLEIRNRRKMGHFIIM